MRRPVVVLALLAVLAVLGTPSAIEAAEPEAHFEPASGSCSGPFVIAGSGYPAETLVTVGIPAMTEIETVTETRTDAGGSFRVALPDSFPRDCRPGQLLGLSAVSEVGGERIFRIASFEVASPYRLSTVACSERESTFAGSGYPPGLSLMLMWVQDIPFTDHAAIIGEVTTDADGTFVESFGVGCLPDGDTIVAGGARLDSTVPSPAATGHGLAATTDRGVPLPLASLALAILGAARLTTRKRRRA